MLLVGRQHYGDDREGIEQGDDLEKDIFTKDNNIPLDMLVKLFLEV